MDTFIDAERRNHASHVLHVANFDIDNKFEKISRTIANLEISNISIIPSNYSGQSIERAGLVRQGDLNAAQVDVIAVWTDVP